MVAAAGAGARGTDERAPQNHPDVVEEQSLNAVKLGPTQTIELVLDHIKKKAVKPSNSLTKKTGWAL